ncbi:MAG: hypothetical protein ACJAR6_000980 [Oleispira sp.]|jgi:hypothetical protein
MEGQTSTKTNSRAVSKIQSGGKIVSHPDKQQPAIKKGRYRHYKGAEYQVIDVARHSETEEWFVVYETRYAGEASSTWVRPAEMFSETVEIGGEIIARFQFID